MRKNVRFTPYASAEFFYDFAKDSWDEQQYAVGIELPYRRVLMVRDLLPLPAHSSAPDNINVLGITLNFFLRNGL